MTDGRKLHGRCSHSIGVPESGSYEGEQIHKMQCQFMNHLLCREAPNRARANVAKYKDELADAKSHIISHSRDVEVHNLSPTLPIPSLLTPASRISQSYIYHHHCACAHHAALLPLPLLHESTG